MIHFLKRYGIWLALLSIPFWNYFNMVFSSMNISDEESLATGTVIMVFVGAFIGRYVAAEFLKTAITISKSLVIGWVTVSLLLFSLFLNSLKMAPYGNSESHIFLLVFVLLFLSILAGFGIKAVTLLIQNRSKKSEEEVLKSKNELQLLQSQLSPHFLFNTLNNLYGLSLVKDDKLPGLLLKLSDLLRHTVYQGGSTFVPLSEELSYLRNYIEFEKIRLEDRLELSVNLEDSERIPIAPLLLIVFVENAFKHSKNSADQSIRIIINVKIWENNILFSVFNTFDSDQTRNNIINNNSGLGLENAKRRLALLYPDKHELNIEKTESTYKVTLQLKTS